MRAFVLFACFVACTPPPPTQDAGPRPVSYARDVAPFFGAKCIACHYPGSPTDLDLVDPFEPTEGLVGVASGWRGPYKFRVVPGSVEESFLVAKIDGSMLDEKTEGRPMPSSVPKVTADELADIRQWISSGANNDAHYMSKVAPVFGNAFNLGRSIGKCSYCHTATSPFSPDVVNAFGPRGLVDVASGFGGKRVVPGDPDASVLVKKLADEVPAGLGAPMPLNYAPATEAEVEAVRQWIRAGAKND